MLSKLKQLLEEEDCDIAQVKGYYSMKLEEQAQEIARRRMELAEREASGGSDEESFSAEEYQAGVKAFFGSKGTS